jgi:hypothetical protein
LAQVLLVLAVIEEGLLLLWEAEEDCLLCLHVTADAVSP